MAKEFPLSLVIKAVDRATAPLRKINERINKFTAPVRKLNNSFKALSDEAGIPRLTKSFKGVWSALGKVGKEALSLGLKIGAMAAGASFALYRIVKGAVDSGDELATMAQRVGLGVDAYAQLQYAAAQADVDAEQFNGSMDQFNKRLGELRAGGGPLKALGDAFSTQLKNAKGPEEAFALVTKAAERFKDPAKKAAFAAVVFGKSGLQMGQFLGQGSAEIDKQRHRFLELAGSQQKFADGASALDNALRETSTAFEGTRNAAMAELFPALTKLAEAATKFIVKNRDGIVAWAKEAAEAIGKWVSGGGIDRLAAGLGDLAKNVGRLAEALGGLKGVLGIVALVMSSGLIASVLSLGGALWKVGAVAIPFLIKAGMLLAPMLKSLFVMMAPLAAPALAFAAALAGVAAAIYQVYSNWSSLKELFTDWNGRAGLPATVAQMFGGAFDPGASPALGAAGAAKPVGASKSESHVVIDLNNAPRGTRVTQSTSGPTELDFSLGYSMVGG